eukprot:jgi/Tetstr1/454916/TSEL_041780.t1
MSCYCILALCIVLSALLADVVGGAGSAEWPNRDLLGRASSAADIRSTATTTDWAATHRPTSGASRSFPVLPKRLLVAYPGWGACGPEVEQAVLNGVNVVAWSFGVLVATPAGQASIQLQPNLHCVRRIVERTAKAGVLHLLSFGGWGTRHPDDFLSGAAYYDAWLSLVWGHRRAGGGPLFDGFDWDFEGADDKAAAANIFSPETLDIMGHMSTLAKADGFLVSIAPAQSYLGPPRPPPAPSFNRSLLLEDAAWEHEFAEEQGAAYVRPFFGYHGANCYAYLLAAHGGWRTFDFVSVQLYESFSLFGYTVQVEGMPVADALVSTVSSYIGGWEVDFSLDPDTRVARLGKRRLRVPAERLVVGLLAVGGNPGAALPATTPPYAKTFTLLPNAAPDNPLQQAYDVLRAAGSTPRGFMYWCIAQEANATDPYYMSRGLAAVLASDSSAAHAGSPP